MVLVNTLSAALAAGATALIALETGGPAWVALAVTMNPGVLLSGVLLSADNMSLALGLLGVLACLRHRSWVGAASLAGAILTRETAFLFAVGLAGWYWQGRYRKQAVALITFSLLPFAAWCLYVQFAIDNAFASAGNLGPPFAGLISASQVWNAQRMRDNIWIAVMLIVAAAGLLAPIRAGRLWRWLTWPWVMLARHILEPGLGSRQQRNPNPESLGHFDHARDRRSTGKCDRLPT